MNPEHSPDANVDPEHKELSSTIHLIGKVVDDELEQNGETDGRGAGGSLLHFRPVQSSDATLLASWLAEPTPENDRLAYYSEPSRWLRLVATIPRRTGYIAYVDNQPVGFLDIEVIQGTAHIIFGIAPAYRGKGLDDALLRAMRSLPELSSAKHIEQAGSRY